MTNDRKIILALVIPAVMQTVVRSLFVIIDAFWVGKMGSEFLASLTVATFLIWGILALGEIISVGTNSLVAQSVGAKNFEVAKNIASENIVTTLFHSFIIGVAIIPVLPILYFLINISESHKFYANEYLIPILLGLPCIILLSTVTAIFRGYGDTKTPFYLLLIAICMNFILAPILIFGVNNNFVWGLRGAAISSLISYFLAFIIGFVILKKRKYINPITKFNFDKNVITETLKIGFPVSLNGVAFSFIYVFVARFVAEYGTTGLASLGIEHRVESLIYQVTVGFSLGATVLVGQQTGAGDSDKAESYAWKVLMYSMFVVIPYSLMMILIPQHLSAFFTTDMNVISASSTFILLTGFVVIFSTAEVILGGAFSGAGDTIPPTIIGLTFNLIRIPAAGIFSYFWGLNGIWIAIVLSVFLKGVFMIFWFRKNKWKNKKTKLLK